MKNFYEVLEIDQQATQQEIKKGYIKLLRKYPPEKNPEEYKTIREAYDTLRDDESKKNYDISLEYGPKLEELEKDGRNYLEDEDYDNAIYSFKKLLMLNPEFALARKLLGQTFLKKRKYKRAINEYIKLLNSYPENIEYICNLGYCYELTGNLEKAERLYKKAYEIDIDDKEAIGWLINLYWSQKLYKKAELLLKNEINKDGKLDFNDYYSYSKLIENYIYMDEPYKVINLIEDIKKIIPNDSQIKNNVSWDFKRLGHILYNAKRYNFSEILLKLSKAFNQDSNEDIDNMINIALLYKLTDNLLNDDKIDGIVKGPLYYYMHGNDENQKERDENLEEVFSCFSIYTIENAEILNDSLSRIKEYYIELYEENKKLYDEFTRLNNIQYDVLDELDLFFNNYSITKSLKLCIAALFDNNDKDFNESLKRLGNEREIDLKKNISDIKDYYPNIYRINSNFLDHLKKLLYK